MEHLWRFSSSIVNYVHVHSYIIPMKKKPESMTRSHIEGDR